MYYRPNITDTEFYNRINALVCEEDSPFTKTIQQGHDGGVYTIFSYRIGSHSDFLKDRDVLIWCRGIMFREESGCGQRLVCMSPAKFWNVGECPETLNRENDQVVEVTEKLDGSLISTYLDATRKVRVKSKTSLHSDQAAAAQKLIENNFDVKAWLERITLEFTVNMEFLGPSNQVVLYYPVHELRVFSCVHLATGRIISGTELQEFLWNTYCPLKQAEVYPVRSVTEIQYELDTVEGIEGYVIKFADGTYAKMKAAKYVLIHKCKDSVMNDKALFELCLRDGVDDLIPLFNEKSVLDRIDAYRAHARDVMIKLDKEIHDFYNTNRELSRKDYAIKGQSECGIRFSLCMSLYLGREVDIIEHILKFYDDYKLPA